MTYNTSHRACRHALMLALLYLVIRGALELLAGVWGFLPEAVRIAFLEGPSAWMAKYVFPPLPLTLMGPVPFGFQSGLNGLSVLFIETVLVFIFGAWALRHGPQGAQAKTGRKAWVVMAAATFLWAVVLRQALLGVMISRQMQQYDTGMAFDELAALLTQSYWTAVPVFYLSTLVWAWAPVWLHFRALGAQSNAEPQPTMAPALKRACVLASFVLGFMLLQYALLQGLFMGLWPWVADVNDIHIPFEELQRQGLPLTLSQIIVPTVAGLLAGYLFSRNAGSYKASRLQLFALPVLAGIATLALTNLLFVVVVWLASYASFELVSGMLLGLTYRPELTYVLLVAFNILSVLVLCVVAVSLRGARIPSDSIPASRLQHA